MNTEFDLIAILNILRHFKYFYNVLSHGLIIEMLPWVLNIVVKQQINKYQ